MIEIKGLRLSRINTKYIDCTLEILRKEIVWLWWMGKKLLWVKVDFFYQEEDIDKLFIE